MLQIDLRLEQNLDFQSAINKSRGNARRTWHYDIADIAISASYQGDKCRVPKWVDERPASCPRDSTGVASQLLRATGDE
jgi:hypothetical protein